MSSGIKTDYNLAYEKFETILNNPEISSCKKLDELRLLQFDLRQMWDTYWTRPCIKNWPCFFDQHKSKIQDMHGRLDIIKLSLMSQCELEMFAKKVHHVVKSREDPIKGVEKSVHTSDNPLGRHI